MAVAVAVAVADNMEAQSGLEESGGGSGSGDWDQVFGRNMDFLSRVRADKEREARSVAEFILEEVIKNAVIPDAAQDCDVEMDCVEEEGPWDHLQNRDQQQNQQKDQQKDQVQEQEREQDEDHGQNKENEVAEAGQDNNDWMPTIEGVRTTAAEQDQQQQQQEDGGSDVVRSLQNTVDELLADIATPADLPRLTPPPLVPLNSRNGTHTRTEAPANTNTGMRFTLFDTDKTVLHKCF